MTSVIWCIKLSPPSPDSQGAQVSRRRLGFQLRTAPHVQTNRRESVILQSANMHLLGVDAQNVLWVESRDRDYECMHFMVLGGQGCRWVAAKWWTLCSTLWKPGGMKGSWKYICQPALRRIQSRQFVRGLEFSGVLLLQWFHLAIGTNRRNLCNVFVL